MTRNILNDLQKLSFSHDDGDSPSTIIFNEIAGDLYPDKSFNSLVEAVKAIEGCETLAEAIAEHGISFKLIAKGDKHIASRWVERNDIACCTEEWFLTGSLACDLWEAIEDDDDIAEEVRDAIENFGSDLCMEVIAECKKRYGSVPTNEEIYSLLHQKACENAPEVIDLEEDEDGIYWGKVNGKKVSLVFISDGETEAEAWAAGLRPTSTFVDRHRLYIQE